MSRRVWLAVGLCCVALALAPGRDAVAAEPRSPLEAPPRGRHVSDKDYELLRRLVDVMDQIERGYVDKGVTREQLLDAAIRGMMKELDPYSNYIPPAEVSGFRTNIDQKFGGVGLQVGVRDKSLTVISPIVGSPAYKAGVQAGDQIVEIEGKSAENVSLDQAVERLKGEAGSEVSFTILRPATGERKVIKVKREVVQLETVVGDARGADDNWSFVLRGKSQIGYIRITAFSQETAPQLQRVLRQLQKQGIKGLIVDLRFNPGGLLGSAVATCDLFLEEGVIVSVKNRNGEERSIKAARGGSVDRNVPVAILVNRYSASASEIVSACLQDHKRAVVVGERTWGKASVQQVVELEGGGAIKLTTSSYHRPNGKNIHKAENAKPADEWGVSPDEGYKLDLSLDELRQLMDHFRIRDQMRARGERPKEAAADADFVDRQLQKAVEYLTTQLAKAE